MFITARVIKDIVVSGPVRSDCLLWQRTLSAAEAVEEKGLGLVNKAASGSPPDFNGLSSDFVSRSHSFGIQFFFVELQSEFIFDSK